jgi:hypothetical protein
MRNAHTLLVLMVQPNKILISYECLFQNFRYLVTNFLHFVRWGPHSQMRSREQWKLRCFKVT